MGKIGQTRNEERMNKTKKQGELRTYKDKGG